MFLKVVFLKYPKGETQLNSLAIESSDPISDPAKQKLYAQKIGMCIFTKFYKKFLGVQSLK